MQIHRIGPSVQTGASGPAAGAGPVSEPRDSFQAGSPDPVADQALRSRQAARIILESSQETREREILFRFETGGSVTAEPTPAADGGFYVSSCDRHLYRADPRGLKRWDASTDGMLYSEPAVGADGTVYVGNNEGTFHAFSPEGRELWKVDTHRPIRARVALDGEGRVYLRGDDDRLRCFLPGGREDWSQSVPASISLKSSPAVTPGGQVLAGGESGQVVAFDARGRELWRRQVGEGPVPPPAVAGDGTLYVATAEGRLVSLDSRGEVRWQKDLGGTFEVSPFVGLDGRVYLHDTRDRFLAVEPDGTVRWSREFDERLSRQPAVDAEGHVFLNVDNQLWRLGAGGEVEWKFRADAGDELWTAPVLRDDGSLLVGGRSGKVYGVKPIDRQFAEEREALEKGTGPANQPGDITPADDGFIRIGGIRLPVKR